MAARGLTIRFQGAENLRDKFLRMAETARLKTLQDAVPPAADIVLGAMREKVPVESGLLKRSLEMEIVERQPGRLVVAMKTPALHWHLVEFGHRMVGPKPGKKEVGTVGPTPFIRPAFDETRNAMKNEIRDNIRDSINGFTI